jgi:microcin C transport system permease protein
MTAYIVRRILFMVPTLFGIMLVSFVVVQFAPGGPVERVIAQLTGSDTGATSRISGSPGGDFGSRGQPGGSADGASSKYRGAQGLPKEFIESLEKQFGFDKPAHERFFLMLWNYIRFDFGKSYFRDTTVLQLIKEKLPVSISLGIWLTLLTYLISIPLGIRKAIKDGSHFDVWTSGAIIIGYAIPGFLFAILLIVLFAGGSFFNFFPLRGLTSEGWALLPWYSKILDYLWHLVLPIISMGLAAFATMTLLTKNSFLDEIRKQYVLTARAKGNSEAPSALRPRLPATPCDRHRGLPRRLRARLLLGLAAHRNPSSRSTALGPRLREPAQPRLCGGIRDALHPVVVGLLVNLVSDPHLHVG